MRNKFYKFLIPLLVFLLAFSSIAGCGKEEENEVVEYGGEPQSFASTDIDLVCNGSTEYKIVIPEVSSYVVSHAADELQLFIKESTGCSIPIITDKGLEHDNQKKYLSVGNTSLLQAQTDIVIDADEINDGGTTINRRDNTVYIAGPTDYGTLYSVYRFLFYQINFVAYAADCVTYDYCSVLKVKDFNYKWRPAFSFVSGSERSMWDNPEDTFRMYHAARDGLGGSGLEDVNLYNGNYCHSAPNFVSKSLYPQLYENGDQLCMTNPLSLQVATDSAIRYAKTAKGPYLQIGGLDHAGICTCEECSRQSELYGGQGGIYIRFLNAVANKVQEYYTQNNYTNELTILGLMYMGYAQAPVVEDENGNMAVIEIPTNSDGTAKDEKLLWNSNMAFEGEQISVGAMCTPIDSCLAHSISDSNCMTNVKELNKIKGWGCVTKKMNVYDYGVNLSGFTYHFNTWSHSQDTFKFYYQYLGGIYGEESTKENGYASFNDFRAFIRGQQARNPWLDTEMLLRDFCEHYYGPAAEEMISYFYAMQENWERIYEIQGNEHFGIFTAIKLNNYWTRSFILDLQQRLKNAMFIVEQSGIDNAEIVNERIYREYFLWLLNEHESYSSYYSPEQLELINEEIEIGRAKYDIYR